MRTIVTKFGGSSTANAGQFKRILGIMRASPARRCAVLSAPGVDAAHPDKVTTLLEECWVCRNDAGRLARSIDRVAGRFREIAAALSLADPLDLVRREILNAVEISLPHTLSRGEYLCATLFSRYSGIPMVDAAEVIAFDDAVDLDCVRTRRGFEAIGNQYGTFILPGFYGADPTGDIRTFPRNGSDITGALAAAGLDAGLYENWTDVDGLMTADPSLVPEARLVPMVGYRQMRAMARAGARVLHPACLDPVAMAGIPTRLRNTMNPACFGTLIDEHCDRVMPALALKADAAPPRSSKGSPMACITAFGLPEDRVRAASEVWQPKYVECDDLSVRVYVDIDMGRECLRGLHHRLIERR